MAMKRIIENADSLFYQFTSNSVESCNEIISKFIDDKRIRFARRGSYEMRVKASVVQFNTWQALSFTCHAIGKEPPACTKIIENQNIAKNYAYQKRAYAAKELDLSVCTSKYFAKTLTSDKDYGPNVERPDIEGNMYEQLRRNHFQMLIDQQRNRDILECYIPLHGVSMKTRRGTTYGEIFSLLQTLGKFVVGEKQFCAKIL